MSTSCLLGAFHKSEGVLRLYVQCVVLQRLLSCSSLFLVAAYRARLHALPPPEAIRGMMPFMSERMRKRRAFADKELETVMYERERQVVSEKMRSNPGPPPTPPAAPTSPIEAASVARQMAPREFLQRTFPMVNPNVLELIWQGCGGNLEKAIEQIVSNSAISTMHATYMAQTNALQQRLMANMVPGAAKLPAAMYPASFPGVTPGAAPQMSLCQPLKGSPNSAFTPNVRSHPVAPPAHNQGPPSASPPFVSPVAYSAAALLASRGVALPDHRSAFQCTPLRSPRSPDSVSSTSSSPSSSSFEKPSPTSSASSPVTSMPSKSPIKFSVESIIGK